MENQPITLELEVRGMSCAQCADHVHRALLSVNGVVAASVPDWKSPRATVRATPTVDEAALIDAVTAAGYQARISTRRGFAVVGAEVETDADFDLAVVGAGSAGFAAAIRGSELGARVALIGDGTLGGTCVNVGCVPSKTLLRAAEAWHRAGHHPFAGVITRQVAFDWAAVRAQKDELVRRLRQEKYADVLAAYPAITFIPGRGRFQADGSLRVGERVIRARKYVITTGAQPRILPIPGADEAGVLTSTTLMDLPTLPRSLLVLGGRAVALELGQMMARFGVQVTLLQRSNRILPTHEPELSRALHDALMEEGIGIVTGFQVERLERADGEILVHGRYLGRPMTYRAEQVLMAVGRRPNTDDLVLETVGVACNADGAIIVDAQMRTSHPAIYAAGDCTTNPEFVYVAAAGGAIAAENALTDAGRTLDLTTMPAVIFTDPQVATVGWTEAEARDRGLDITTSLLPLAYVPRALAARDIRGLIKWVVAGENGRLLGAHVVAAEAGEVIQTAVLALRCGLTANDLIATLFPYLTQVEGLKLAAQAVHKDVTRLSCCAF